MSTSRASRRPHTKSRNGCGQCKKRKVKVLTSDAVTSVVPDVPTVQNGKNSAIMKSLVSPRAIRESQYLGGKRSVTSSPDPVPSPPNINLEHLELMHHYAVNTAQTFQDPGDGRWDILIPAQAQSYEFLMHALLSVSALHIVHLKSRDSQGDPSTTQYLSRAHTHHAQALALFRSTITDITPANGTATAAFSLLFLIFSCGISQLSSTGHKQGQGKGQFQDPIDAIITMIRYFRSYRKLFMAMEGWIDRFPPAVQSPPQISENVRYPRAMDALNDLLNINDMSPHSDVHKAIYRDTIIQLQQSLDCGSALPRHLWPLSVPDEYLALLEQRQPMALVILAYGSNLTQDLQLRWFVYEWIVHITNVIAGQVGEEWRESMRWPLSQCGFSPDEERDAMPLIGDVPVVLS
ncbi:hypothetical protein IFR05_009639 [Cadophora sp. M221]|nr:hypothetical protein IFR05_009639 [Cadophora sp. M221]